MGAMKRLNERLKWQADEAAAEVAKDVFGFTLKKQWSDTTDFHDVSVWDLEAALKAAFRAGAAAALEGAVKVGGAV